MSAEGMYGNIWISHAVACCLLSRGTADSNNITHPHTALPRVPSDATDNCEVAQLLRKTKRDMQTTIHAYDHTCIHNPYIKVRCFNNRRTGEPDGVDIYMCNTIPV
jgi:hypothetical protein